MSLKFFLLVGIGGAAGSMLRFFVQYITQQFYMQSFPLATFIVNIIGCFLIGMIYSLAEKHQILKPEWRLLLTTGFCGGFTTFSAFTLENVLLFQSGKNLTAILYIIASVLLGIIATLAGVISFK